MPGGSGRLHIPGEEPRTEEVHLSPIREDGVLSDFLVRKRDITRELALQERLYQSQKTEEIGRLAGGVAHDFGNLMAIIVAYTHLLETGNPDDISTSLAAIRRSTDRASALIQQLLDFGRLRPTRSQILDLNQLVSKVSAMLARVIGEHIELRTRLGPYLGHIKADPGQLEQVLTNLVVNARDALPGGGVITMETATVELGQENVDVPPGRYVCLSVADTGIGMDSGTLARAFEPFFTTKPVGQGTGLGLATVQSIIHGSGGHIRVQSAKGKGTCFRIYLPCHDAPISLSVSSGTTSRLEDEPTETLLIVEDEAELGLAVASLLEARGYQVLRARGGEDALGIFKDHADQVNLVVTDATMPGMNGRALAAALRQHRPDLKILFMSGFAGDAQLVADIRAGAAFLPKPFTAPELYRAVRQALQVEMRPTA